MPKPPGPVCLCLGFMHWLVNAAHDKRVGHVGIAVIEAEALTADRTFGLVEDGAAAIAQGGRSNIQAAAMITCAWILAATSPLPCLSAMAAAA